MKITRKKLESLVRELSFIAGIPAPKLSIIQDDTSNAFFSHRIYALYYSRTYLNTFKSEAQLAWSVGHELSHIKQDWNPSEYFKYDWYYKQIETEADLGGLDLAQKAGYNIIKDKDIIINGIKSSWVGSKQRREAISCYFGE